MNSVMLKIQNLIFHPKFLFMWLLGTNVIGPWALKTVFGQGAQKVLGRIHVACQSNGRKQWGFKNPDSQTLIQFKPQSPWTTITMAPTYSNDIPSRLEKTLFLLGGYTDKSVLAHAPAGGEGDGLYSVLFDPEMGSLKTMSSSNIKTNPAFIMKHPSLDIVYMTTEVISDNGSEILVGELDR